MLTQKPTVRQITASQTKPVSLPGQGTNNPHSNGKNSPTPATPVVRTYSVPDPVNRLSVEDVLYCIAFFVCFATPLAAFIWAGAAGVGFIGCLAALLGSLFVTMSVLAVVAVLVINWREILTFACVIVFFWLLLLAVRFLAN
jgi:hypothetical protein